MPTKRPTVSVLGCGWLGRALAQHLLRYGWKVKGSTTQLQNHDSLQRDGIEPFVLRLGSEPGDHWMDFLQADALVLNVPPRHGQHLQDIEFLLERIRERTRKRIGTPTNSRACGSSISHLIYVSSTSVFGETQGDVDEATVPQPETNGGCELLEAERWLMSQNKIPSTILRLGGLIGPERHPGRFLAGRQNLPRGSAPVNLIHQKDAVGILHRILERGPTASVFHGVAYEHPTRRDFYTAAAESLGLEPPSFIDEPDTRPGKRVQASGIEKELEYLLQYPSPLATLFDPMAWS